MRIVRGLGALLCLLGIHREHWWRDGPDFSSDIARAKTPDAILLLGMAQAGCSFLRCSCARCGRLLA